MRDVGVVIGRHRVGHVDDDVDAFQRISQTAPGDQVDTVRTSELDHRDIAAFQPGNDAGSGRAGCPNDSDGRRGTPTFRSESESGWFTPENAVQTSFSARPRVIHHTLASTS